MDGFVPGFLEIPDFPEMLEVWLKEGKNHFENRVNQGIENESTSINKTVCVKCINQSATVI